MTKSNLIPVFSGSISNEQTLLCDDYERSMFNINRQESDKDDIKTNIDSRLSDVLHSLSVLNTPSNSGSRTRQLCGFFVSIDYGRVASSTYNTFRGKTAGRLLAVFKYLTTPLNKGFNNLTGHKS